VDQPGEDGQAHGWGSAWLQPVIVKTIGRPGASSPPWTKPPSPWPTASLRRSRAPWRPAAAMARDREDGGRRLPGAEPRPLRRRASAEGRGSLQDDRRRATTRGREAGAPGYMPNWKRQGRLRLRRSPGDPEGGTHPSNTLARKKLQGMDELHEGFKSNPFLAPFAGERLQRTSAPGRRPGGAHRQGEQRERGGAEQDLRQERGVHSEGRQARTSRRAREGSPP
jgi:hypothetical protein